MMFPQSRHSASSQQLKFTTSDSCDRIKDEFQFLQAQYHSLKLECDKLASEKSEMQRHYIMYYEMSYGLNIEMHKQAEIVKRLNGICAQVLPYLSQEHQQQVLAAIERAKQVTPPRDELHHKAASGSPAVSAPGPGPAHDPPAAGPEPADPPRCHHLLRSLLPLLPAGLPSPAGQGGEVT
ncbi:TLE family member 5 isoform X1 [Lates japonicus]